MSRRLLIPNDTLLAQKEASDPLRSVWVSAHAGSGKTHVLSQRVVRLLLAGTDPSRILCLTYTRAAAANMANRIFRDLGRWAMLEDAALAEQISAIDGRRASPETCRKARRLFAQALETPGGLKIQTIHAFCEALLHQFPLEANIAGHFELLEGQAAEALVAEARRRLLLGTAGETDPELTAAFATVLARGGEWGLEQLLDEIVAKRDDLAAAIADLDQFELREEHGFRPEESAESLALEVWPDAFFDAALAETVLDCAAGKVKATSFAEGLKAVCASSGAPAFSAICQLFLTAKGEPRKSTHIAVKEVVSRIPGFADHYDRMASALLACTDRIALLEMVQATEAALVIAERLIGSYFRMKHARGFLDFEDLIRRTIALLAREDAGPWIRYRLDQGIDHILVDEAQDTSPQQWAVIRQLSDEFFSGQGARPNTERTIFAVGDQKQSIYSFQGAEPESFEWNRQSFKRDVEAAERSFNTIKLERSFRSTEDVLSAVDAVFSDFERRRGLSPDGGSFQHRPIRLEPGFVEVWSSVGQTVAPEPDDWTLSIDHAKAPAVQVAERIADRIQTWLKDKEMLPGTGRPVSPGDVMVLVRKRDSFIHALTRALKNRNIAVAGADRLSLPAHIAVKDLVALGRIVLQPDDDLSLAALLKSPIFGLDDNALFAFAYKRGEGVSLYTSLRRAAADDLVLHSVVQQLDSWRKEAGFKPAFEFFAGLLGAGGVRQKMISRLGHEAGEIIDEFQSFLLAAEQAGAVDLEAVLALLSQSGPDIKREMDQTRNEVRIMTVHAAKGLEAPVVFLVDSGGEPFSASHLPRLLPYEASSGRKRFLWRASKDLSNAATRQIEAVLRAKAEDEYRRLLYVGMTRAEDRLVVCGYHGKNPPRGATWLSMVQAGLSDLPDTTTLHDEEQGTVLRYQVSRGAAVEPEQRDLSSPPALPPVPAFLRELAPPPTRLPRPLAPSRASALIETEPRDAQVDRSPVLDEDTQPGFAILRGTAIHRLLQLLPDLPREDQRSAATRYLGRIGGAWPAGEREAALQSVFAVIEDPSFAPLFAPGSRAEVGVMGTLDVGSTPRAIAGTVDRLVVTEDAVLIVDYKTNRPAPQDLLAVPDAYVVQLTLYRALLKEIYPGKAVSAALLFTEGPILIPLPHQIMDEALKKLRVGSQDGTPLQG